MDIFCRSQLAEGELIPVLASASSPVRLREDPAAVHYYGDHSIHVPDILDLFVHEASEKVQQQPHTDGVDLVLFQDLFEKRAHGVDNGRGGGSPTAEVEKGSLAVHPAPNGRNHLLFQPGDRRGTQRSENAVLSFPFLSPQLLSRDPIENLLEFIDELGAPSSLLAVVRPVTKKGIPPVHPRESRIGS
jgi:hypothetical protein